MKRLVVVLVGVLVAGCAAPSGGGGDEGLSLAERRRALLFEYRHHINEANQVLAAFEQKCGPSGGKTACCSYVTDNADSLKRMRDREHRLAEKSFLLKNDGGFNYEEMPNDERRETENITIWIGKMTERMQAVVSDMPRDYCSK